MESESKADASGKSATAESSEQPILSRRAFGTGAAVAVGATGAGLGYLLLGSQPALAVDDPEEWIANSAEITTQDGSVDAITFGDPDELEDSEELEDDDNRLIVEWSGLNSATSDADFNVYLAGTDGGDGGDWTGGEEPTETTDEENLAEGETTLDGTSGAEAFTWVDIFEDSQPIDVEAHPEIELSDFEAVADGSTTVRELEVTIEVIIPEEDDLSATQTADATITVTNEEAELQVGGQGSFEIESDQEVTE